MITRARHAIVDQLVQAGQGLALRFAVEQADPIEQYELAIAHEGRILSV